jgi:hypothetical protein
MLIDVLVQKHYGCTLDELLCYAYRKGSAEGHEVGYTKGDKEGFRRGKGRRKSTRTTAKQLIPLLVSKIGWRANNKQVGRASVELLRRVAVGHHVVQELHKVPQHDLKARVDEFLRTHRQPWGRADSLPTPSTLTSEYYRQRGQLSKGQ